MGTAYFMGIDTGTSETKGVLIDVDANKIDQVLVSRLSDINKKGAA